MKSHEKKLNKPLLLTALLFVIAGLLYGGPFQFFGFPPNEVQRAGAATIVRVQQNAGEQNGGSLDITMSLVSPSTAGNLLVATIGSGSNGAPIQIPTGWTEAVSVSGGIEKIIYKVTSGGETSWQYFHDAPDQTAWVVAEYSSSSGWPAVPATLDVVASAPNRSGVTSRTSGTTTVTSQANALAVAGWKIRNGTAAAGTPS